MKNCGESLIAATVEQIFKLVLKILDTIVSSTGIGRAARRDPAPFCWVQNIVIARHLPADTTQKVLEWSQPRQNNVSFVRTLILGNQTELVPYSTTGIQSPGNIDKGKELYLRYGSGLTIRNVGCSSESP